MAKTMSMQVKKCQLRDKPTFLGKIVTNLAYADQVTAKRKNKDWCEVVPASKKDGGLKPEGLDFAKTHPLPEKKRIQYLSKIVKTKEEPTFSAVQTRRFQETMKNI